LVDSLIAAFHQCVCKVSQDSTTEWRVASNKNNNNRDSDISNYSTTRKNYCDDNWLSRALTLSKICLLFGQHLWFEDDGPAVAQKMAVYNCQGSPHPPLFGMLMWTPLDGKIAGYFWLVGMSSADQE
jgi:hypothetical protein